MSRLMVIAAIFAAAAGLLGHAAPARAAAPLVVTLGFDDGWSDQTRAADILGARGLHATFFLISGKLGQSNRLTVAQAQALQAAGNEIGGHTRTHPHLSTLTADQQRMEICDDRDALLVDGFSPVSFAYPYGDHDATSERMAAGCGYNSARTVAGVACGTGCVPAESFLPPDRYATRAYATNENTTVARLESIVTAAVAGGGWLQFVFHHVCDPGAGCGPDTITPANLTALADFLAAGQAAGTLTVKTTGQVLAGPVAPAVPVLPDPSLEDGAGALPACWAAGGYGSSAATFTRTADAAGGARAVRIDMTAYTSGDRKLITAQDSGACAPAALAGHRYTVRAAYHSDDGPRLIVYYRAADGTWTYLAKSAALPAAAGYRQAAFTAPPLPAGATAISVGMLLDRVGSVTVDDFALDDTGENLLPAGGFEVDGDGDGVPDCTQRTGYGTATFQFARTAQANTGNWAEWLQVTSLTSGDRKVLSSFDPACAPAVIPGFAYATQAWYRSDSPVRLLVYYRTPGGWTFWTKTAPLPASPAWTQATLTTPPAPADATALAAGVMLDHPGWVAVDDLAAYEQPAAG